MLFALFALFALPGIARAQVNAETLTAAVKDPGWAFGASGALSFASGNTNVLTASVDASVHHLTVHPRRPEVDRGWFRDRFLLNGQWTLKQLLGEEAQNQGFVHARYTRMLVPRFGVEALGQLQYDRQLLLDWRVLGGAGVRVVLACTPRFRGWLGSAYLYEYEDRDLPEGTADARFQHNHRWSSYVSFTAVIAPDRLTLVGTAYVQPRFDDLDDLQILAEGRLEVGVLPWFSLGLPVYVRHDSRPPADLAPTDIRVGAALVLRAALRPREARDAKPADEKTATE